MKLFEPPLSRFSARAVSRSGECRRHLLAPHRKNRRPEKCTSDGRRMRRYRNRWRVERAFAHAGNSAG